MTGSRTRSVAALPLALLLAACNTGTTPATGAVRVLNAVNGASSVNVLADGQFVVGGIAMPGSSGYQLIPQGYREIKVVAASGGATLTQTTMPVVEGEFITLVASGSVGGPVTPAATVLLDTQAVVGNGLVLLRVVHAAAGSAAVDLAATLRPAGSTTPSAPPILVPFRTGSYFLEVAAGSFNLELVDNATGAPIATFPTGALVAGSSTTALVVDAPSGSGAPVAVAYF